MGYSVVNSQLHNLGVNHQQADILRRGLIQKGNYHGVYADGLTGAGGARYEQMGHFCKVGNRHPAAYVPSESHGKRRFRSAEFLRVYKLLYAYNVHVAVRNLYAHRRLVGNGRFYSDASRRKVQGYIVRKSRYFAAIAK